MRLSPAWCTATCRTSVQSEPPKDASIGVSVTALLDPLGPVAWKLAPMLELLRDALNVGVKVRLALCCKGCKISDLPPMFAFRGRGERHPCSRLLCRQARRLRYCRCSQLHVRGGQVQSALRLECYACVHRLRPTMLC